MADVHPLHRVVIVGGGFGGLRAAQCLRNTPVDVTLIDRRNFHVFQPLLYQVATGSLSPANIAAPLRAVLKKSANTRVLLGRVVGIDVAQNEVILKEHRVPYDSLILATGSHHNYFGHPEWAKNAPGLKTIEDATEMRRNILFAFEAAERAATPEEREAAMTFVVVGAGPTGVELAGALAEIARHTLPGEFRSIHPEEARILLIDLSDRVLPPYPPELSAKAERALRRIGVDVQLKTGVIDIGDDFVILKSPEGEQRLSTRTVLWAAGVQASSLGKMLANQTGADTDRAGRVSVTASMEVPGHPTIFVIGDLASCRSPQGTPLPALAPVARQQGEYVARRIGQRLLGKPTAGFRYRDWGSMATIGRKIAVAQIKNLRFNGVLAWLAWLFIHLMYLVGFQSRLLVLIQWSWNYATRSRHARLITGDSLR